MAAWRLAAVTGWLLLGFVIVAPVLIADARPHGDEQVGVLGDEAHWVCNVSYTPGLNWAMLGIQMDNMGGRQRSEYRIESSESWFPQLGGTIDGAISDFVYVQFTVQTPEPMDLGRAIALANNLSVTVVRDGKERTVTFFDRYSRGEPHGLLKRLKSFWIDSLTEPVMTFH